MNTAAQTKTAQETSTRSVELVGSDDRYLTLRLGSETYAIEILRVREIIEPIAITRLPNAHSSIQGVINLRGKIISIVDLKQRLNMGKTKFSEQTVIIVLQYERGGVERSFGVLVDEVLEVISLDQNCVSPTPDSSDSADDEFLTGVAEIEESVVFLLGLENALTDDNA